MKPRVTILLAAYNAAATLPRCLDSLLGQSLGNIEVIAVDDCSTDSTLLLLQTYAKQDSRVKVLQTPTNSGQAVARNLALKEANGELVCMVDADDWLSPDCLQQASDVFCQHPRTDTVILHLMQHYEETQIEEEYPLPKALTRNGIISGREAMELCIDGWQLHGLYVARAELFQQYPYDTTTRLYSDDTTTCFHYLHSREVRLCGGIYYYSKHQASSTNAFHFHRFDYLEAMLSQKLALKKENISKQLMRRFEGRRWYIFIGCYRLFLQHQNELTDKQQASLKERFKTILHTFRPSQLKLRYRWKPFYWWTSNTTLFGLQQKLYIKIRG
ncbi:MAG: glycosyltransferase family 2 protein [Bacteroidaceae bacterium]|nr:glycosyltransferase family 2 protein [Bacteroidaceae bacterium]